MKLLLSKIYLVISSTIAINILYFIWQPYEKCIIDFPLRETWLPDIFTNVLYLLIYFGWLIIMFFTSMNSIYMLSPLKTVFKMFGALFLLQIPLEFIKFASKIYIPQLQFVVQDLCSAAGLFLGILILFKISKNHISIKSKQFIFLVLVLALLIVGAQALRNMSYMDVVYANNKYVSTSGFIKVENQNHQFICEILSLACEIVNSSLIFLTYLFASKKNPVNSDKGATKTVQEFNGKTITKIVVYSLLLVAAFFTIAPVKTFVFSYSSLAPRTGITLFLPVHSGELDTNLDRGIANKSINRYLSPKYVKSVYNISDISFGSNNMVLYEFNVNYSMLENLPLELKSLMPYECVFDDSKINFYTYGNELLIIKTNKFSYRFIELKNINNLQEDAVVTKCIKHMLTEGVFSYFEYGCSYLNKYDNDFIKPYIDRYAKGGFNSKETRNVYNTDINRDYIQNLAKEFQQKQRT